MRWRICPPDRIATRIGLTVLAALLAIMGVVALIRTTEESVLWPPTGLDIAGRIASIVMLVDRTPWADRPETARRFDGPEIEVQWHETLGFTGDDRSGKPLFSILRRQLLDRLAAPDAQIRIDVSRALAPFQHDGSSGSNESPHVVDVLQVAVRLSDQSWVAVAITDPRFGMLRLVHWPLPFIVAGIVIVLVSWWAARKITAPLAGFAAAAERLGTDPDAPPLVETGPREIRDATRAFNRMQMRLKRYVDDRMQMLAAISHDLRTPLTRLRLRAELIEDPEQLRKTLADIAEMEAMINATLAFARDDARAEARTRVDLAALLQTICDDLTDTGHLAALGDAARCPIACRPGAMRRAFSNLIDNAVKYGGRADVGLAIEAGHAVVTVDDHGPGIPADELESVFLPFYRLERSRSRDTGGVGLGLAVVKTIIHAHGGDIQLANRPDGGLRASVSLPLDVAPRAAARDKTAPAAQVATAVHG
jgi:signal transduction histidine kinase